MTRVSVTEAGSVYSEPDFPHGYYGGNVLLTELDSDALAWSARRPQVLGV